MCCFECENDAQLKSPKIDLGMLQIEKSVMLHERMVTAFTRAEVSALQIKTSACNKNLTGDVWTPFLTQGTINNLKQMETNWNENYFSLSHRITCPPLKMLLN